MSKNDFKSKKLCSGAWAEQLYVNFGSKKGEEAEGNSQEGKALLVSRIVVEKEEDLAKPRRLLDLIGGNEKRRGRGGLKSHSASCGRKKKKLTTIDRKTPFKLKGSDVKKKKKSELHIRTLSRESFGEQSARKNGRGESVTVM